MSRTLLRLALLMTSFLVIARSAGAGEDKKEASVPKTWVREWGLRMTEPPEDRVRYVIGIVDIPSVYKLAEPPTIAGDPKGLKVHVVSMGKFSRLFVEGDFETPAALPIYLVRWKLVMPDPDAIRPPVLVRRVQAILESGSRSRTYDVSLVAQAHPQGKYTELP